jgi:hypothetical protein
LARPPGQPHTLLDRSSAIGKIKGSTAEGLALIVYDVCQSSTSLTKISLPVPREKHYNHVIEACLKARRAPQ